MHPRCQASSREVAGRIAGGYDSDVRVTPSRRGRCVTGRTAAHARQGAGGMQAPRLVKQWPSTQKPPAEHSSSAAQG